MTQFLTMTKLFFIGQATITSVAEIALLPVELAEAALLIEGVSPLQSIYSEQENLLVTAVSDTTPVLVL